ncbi:MAG: deoxyguanosinetriphosphate triphosphohydrolase [Proteobacteria bacterium]|jgi:dGTPase|nr:deoxyguanosinetriphosphate triphosphohydrolase [Pseudomonadota bacterium]MCG6934328.1 deoxyguanosinetriphosphate triphosphohydrolase [Pseudomonadota bacterium]
MMNLAPYAATDTRSRGRRYPEPSPVYRSEYQRDRDRIIHSAAFRRLEYKTQVFVNHEGDMFRTRLTHSIEVAQISRSIARILNLNEDLSETIALAHDLGHTPFGHAGQDALNACMQNYGGFEHNLQSLRTVDILEERYADFPGLNLTFESREGILKHCSLRNAEQLGEVGQRFINKTQPSLEAQLVNLADQIAYNNHDIDDGLRSGLIRLAQLTECDLFEQQYNEVKARYPNLAGRRLVHEIIRRMINLQIVDLIETSQTRLAELEPQSIDDIRQQNAEVIHFSDKMQGANQRLKQFLRTNLYSHYRVHRMTNKARKILQSLFDAFMHDPRLLKPEHQTHVKQLDEAEGESGRARAVADYIAGMTDRYAITEYRRIFDPEELT